MTSQPDSKQLPSSAPPAPVASVPSADGANKADAANSVASSSPSRKMRTFKEASMWVAEIVGDQAHEGKRMDAGSILDIMDLLAGRIAWQHAAGRVVTLSFDRVDLSVPILHNDLVRLEGQLVRVGNSSMVVEVRCYRHDIYAKEFVLTHKSFITMVALNEQGRPNKNIPGLEYQTADEAHVGDLVSERDRLSREWAAIQESIEKSTKLRVADVEDPLNHGKNNYVTIASTEIVVRRQFLPRHRNLSNQIFGGDILTWMDRVANYCVHAFTGNKHVITLNMNRVFFKKPVDVTDLVEMRARICYVRTYTVCVEISVWIHSINQPQPQLSHTGYFTVLNFDEAGFKRKVLTGIALSDANQDELKAYAVAKSQYLYWEQHAERLSQQMDPVTDRLRSVTDSPSGLTGPDHSPLPLTASAPDHPTAPHSESKAADGDHSHRSGHGHVHHGHGHGHGGKARRSGGEPSEHMLHNVKRRTLPGGVQQISRSSSPVVGVPANGDSSQEKSGPAGSSQ